MSIRLVTFDLDNTLWAVDPVIRAAEQRMRGYLGSEVPSFAERVDQDVMADLRDELLHRHPELRHDLSAMRVRLLQMALVHCGLSLTAAEPIANEAFRHFLDARHDVVLFDDAHDVLEDLSARYTLGALSNGNADVTRLQIGRFFHFAHSSASAGASKPHPAMFHAALADAGVNAEQAVHIGDHLVDDIEGAAAVGMHTIWVNFDASPQEDVNPTVEVSALADLPAAIDALARSLS